MNSEPDECYSLAQAAAVLKVDPRTCLKFIDQGELIAKKLPNGHWRINKESTHALLPKTAQK